MRGGRSGAVPGAAGVAVAGSRWTFVAKNCICSARAARCESDKEAGSAAAAAVLPRMSAADPERTLGRVCELVDAERARVPAAPEDCFAAAVG